MPERIQQEEPIQPLSFSGGWRSTMALMEVFRDRPAPTCTFLLALATWIAAAYRTIWPELADPGDAGTCLVPDVIFAPYSGEWRRYLLHPLWPLERGYARSFVNSAALLLLGYTLEYEVGALHFGGLLLGLHVAAAAVLLHVRFTTCHVSSEPALAALAVVMHRVNPKVHTDGLDRSLRLPFPVEPRWHMWLLQSSLLLLSSDFSAALVAQGAGLALGALLCLKDPELWLGGWRAVRQRSFGLGAALHVALMLFAFLFMPLSAQTLPTNVVQAFLDGRALQRSWWQASFLGSDALLHLALDGKLSPEALFICKLMISFAFPLLLSPFRLWTRFYAGGCALLAMYSMNAAVWRYPHVGFSVLIYLVWALWKLPGVSAKEHAT